MSPDQLSVSLTTFEKLETLRTELKEREQEMQKVERDLNTALRALATYRFLKGIAPFYANRPAPPEATAVPELEKRRQSLIQVVQAIRTEIPRLEAAAVSGKAPRPAQAPRGRFKF